MRIDDSQERAFETHLRDIADTLARCKRRTGRATGPARPELEEELGRLTRRASQAADTRQICPELAAAVARLAKCCG